MNDRCCVIIIHYLDMKDIERYHDEDVHIINTYILYAWSLRWAEIWSTGSKHMPGSAEFVWRRNNSIDHHFPPVISYPRMIHGVFSSLIWFGCVYRWLEIDRNCIFLVGNMMINRRILRTPFSEKLRTYRIYMYSMLLMMFE